ncbi:putative transcriptional regulator [Novosphingobium chloroacetimidivorans]|uniref:Putative transcriptional regulator n=1 Tax=Novosphingobium chloroacetimidivorans TaxID=1428314 RepID=A0A7W7K8S6_9SPHN|nr:MucR family transcriptional regulator [Novosphingobium chloroacetimidivorans]MBB4858340.1 putative transcriptional regulator [Novosphingobium chloroacetimidivorans]
MPEVEQTADVTTLTVQLLSAYLANNSVASGELADLIRTTRAALTGEAEVDAAAAPETFTPAVSVRKSLASSEHIISLIDGKPYKTLKRHLASHGLTPDTYRTRYNLPSSYPMVAPDYAAHRRAVAQKVGLGTRKPVADTAEPTEPVEAADQLIEAALPDATPEQQPEPTKAPAKKTSGRPAKKTAEASPDENTSASDAPSPKASDTPVEAEGAAAPKRKAGKAPSRPRKATKTEAEGESSAATAEPSSPSADEAAPETAAPKRRGRIGLFKAGASETTAKGDAEPQQANAAGPVEAASPKSQPKPKKKAPRMAREPGKAAAAKDSAS